MPDAISPASDSTGRSKLPLGGFVLDLGSEALRGADGSPVELRPQAWAVLRQLAMNAGCLVTKDELLAAVWPGLVVTDSSLAQAVCDIRGALGDAGHRLVKTIPRRGYMLVADAPASPDGDQGGTGEPVRPKAPDWPSIAVLAFRDAHGDATGQLVARGFAQDLLAELARNIDLRVVSHHSSFVFADTDTPLAEIGRQLRCRYLVDGTVRHEGELLRITVELIDSDSGEIVWTARHDAGSATVLAQRDALVRRIAGTLHASARHAEARSVLARPPKTLDAYALTARAVAMRSQFFRPEAFQESRDLFLQGLAIDPNYAPAWAYLAELNAFHALSGSAPDAQTVEMLAHDCRLQAQRALTLDPENPMAWRVMSYAHELAREHAAQLAAAQRAVELTPSNADNLFALAMAQLSSGQAQAALATIEDVLALYPLPPAWVPAMHAGILWANGQLEAALRSAEQCLSSAPHLYRARVHRIAALVELGRTGEARDEAVLLQRQLPWITAEQLLRRYADSAVSLRERTLAALLASGIPRATDPLSPPGSAP